MSIQNNIISATGVSIADVQLVLGSNSADIGTLCTHSRVNKWSKHKPYSHAHVYATDVSVLGQDSYEKLASSVNYGFSINPQHYAGGTWKRKEIYWELTRDSSNWIYNPPTGGKNSPYRLGDFRYYYKDAIPFIRLFDDKNSPITDDSHEIEWNPIENIFKVIAITNDSLRSSDKNVYYSLAMSDFKDGVIPKPNDTNDRIENARLAISVFDGKFDPYTAAITKLTPIYVKVNDKPLSANRVDDELISISVNYNDLPTTNRNHQLTALVSLALPSKDPADKSVNNMTEAPYYIVPFPRGNNFTNVLNIKEHIANVKRFQFVGYQALTNTNFTSTYTDILETTIFNTDYAPAQLYFKIKVRNLSTTDTILFKQEQLQQAYITSGYEFEYVDIEDFTGASIAKNAYGYITFSINTGLFSNVARGQNKTINIKFSYQSEDDSQFYDLGNISIRWNHKQ